MLTKTSPKIAVIVIPTYNEAGIIGKTITYLSTKTFPDIVKKKNGLSFDWVMKILVVDGNSPDGTSRVVESMSKKFSNVFLYTETSKDGIGAAYLKGFKYSIDKLSADFLFEFDSDLQHPPETIPIMLKKIEQGYDYVLGSRKIKGGSNPKGWGFKRLLFSEVGGFVARFILFFPFKNFWKVTDPTTGLKVTRVKGFADNLDLDYKKSLLTKSFAYKLQLLYQLLKMHAKYTEIPLQFHVRTTGESKIETQTAKETFRVAFLLRWRDELTQKFFKFGIIGSFGFLINFFGLKYFNSLYKNFILPIGLINFLANATASEISIISNFTFNNLWTFSSEKITGFSNLFKKFVTFNLSSVFSGIIVPSVIIGLGTQIFGDQTRYLFLFIGVFGFTIPFNWFAYTKIIWRK